MEEIGLFPLGVVLLPSEVMPLHIFEPRYRELIGECLETDAPFGLVQALKDGLAPVGTYARVQHVLERFEDGRLHVVVVGGERFRVQRLTSGRSFHTAVIEAVDDDDDPADQSLVEHAVEIAARIGELVGAEASFDDIDRSSPVLSFELAGRFELGVEVKQELLEMRSEHARVERLCRALEDLERAVARAKEIAHLARGNGKLKPPG